MLNQPWSRNMCLNNCKLSHTPTHTIVYVIRIEPMLMVLQNPNLKSNPKIKITCSWNLSCFVCIDLCYALDSYMYLQCTTLLFKTRRAPINMSHGIVAYIISLTSIQPWEIIRYMVHELNGGWWMCMSTTMLGWFGATTTHGC